jgi:hypothetical protein
MEEIRILLIISPRGDRHFEIVESVQLRERLKTIEGGSIVKAFTTEEFEECHEEYQKQKNLSPDCQD